MAALPTLFNPVEARGARGAHQTRGGNGKILVDGKPWMDSPKWEDNPRGLREATPAAPVAQPRALRLARCLRSRGTSPSTGAMCSLVLGRRQG